MERVADRHVGDFMEQDLCMTLRIFSLRESLRAAWSLFKHAQHVGISFSVLWFGFGALLCESERRDLLEYEIALLKVLQHAACNPGVKMSFGDSCETCCGHARC